MGTYSKDLQDRKKFVPYYEVFEIYINGTKVYRKYGIKSAIAFAERTCGDLFGERRVEVVNADTGEVVYQC